MNENFAAVDRQDHLEDETSGFSLDLGELRSMVYRQRYIIGGAVILALALGLLATMLATPRYSSLLTVLIDHRGQQVVEGGDVEERIKGGDIQRYLQGQVELLKSRNMAGRVVDDLGLAANDNFLLAMNVEVTTKAPAGVNLHLARRTQVITALTENVSVNMSFGSNIANISFESPSKTIAVMVTNAYGKNLITGNIQQRFEATSYARDFLKKEILDAKNRLEESEQAALQYAEKSEIIDASDGVSSSPDNATPRSITTANLVQINAEAAHAKTVRIRAEEKWRQASRTSLMRLPEVLSNPAIQNLQAERSRRIAKRQELSDRYKPDHPAYKEVTSQISIINTQINRLAANIRAGIRGEYDIARNQETSLNRNLGEAKSETASEQRKRIQLNLLNREIDTNQILYQALLKRYEQVSTSADIVNNNISIVDKAESTWQIAPRPFVNMALALFSGVTLGFLLAFIRETFDDSLRSLDDVRRKLGLPLLGTTPVFDGSQPIIELLKNRQSAIAEAFASIRSSLDFSTNQGVPGSLLITSSQPSEGKSTSSIAICESFGRAGKKVLLVDADLRLPSLHKHLNLENNDGFVSLLTGHSTLEKQAQRSKSVDFDFLSCGPVPPDPTGIIVADAIQRFINQYESKYDLILIDGPPVMGLADSPQISRAVGGTIMVVEAAKVHGGKTKTALRRLNDANANILGVLLTKFDDKKSGYGDYYAYNYGYGAGKNPKGSWYARLFPGSARH
ncbi:MAG: polysaccharide biosynthesis tyrosine autokinase [Sphingorhabdus sp.]